MDPPGEPDPAVVEALRRAAADRPWTVEAVREYATDPAATKATASLCATCEAPCEDDEVCATVVAREAGVLDEVGREQAFRLVESGMRRLRLRGEAAVREGGEHRPNQFVSLAPAEE